MADWSWASTAGLFGEEDEEDAVDPDQKVSKHDVINIESINLFQELLYTYPRICWNGGAKSRKSQRGKTRGSLGKCIL